MMNQSSNVLSRLKRHCRHFVEIFICFLVTNDNVLIKIMFEFITDSF